MITRWGRGTGQGTTREKGHKATRTKLASFLTSSPHESKKIMNVSTQSNVHLPEAFGAFHVKGSDNLQ